MSFEVKKAFHLKEESLQIYFLESSLELQCGKQVVVED